MQIIKKISLAGDGMVGKTSLIRRYVFDQFSDKYLVTIGTKVTRKDIKTKWQGKEVDLTLMIWDIMGLTGYHSRLHKKNFHGTKGALIVCDNTRLDSLISLSTWAQQIEDVAGQIPMVFLANKSDLKEKAEFTEEDLKEECKKHNVPYLYTSAKTGENVEKAFALLAERVIAETEE
jgi:small GTP-binding protein